MLWGESGGRGINVGFCCLRCLSEVWRKDSYTIKWKFHAVIQIFRSAEKIWWEDRGALNTHPSHEEVTQTKGPSARGSDSIAHILPTEIEPLSWCWLEPSLCSLLLAMVLYGYAKCIIPSILCWTESHTQRGGPLAPHSTWWRAWWRLCEREWVGFNLKTSRFNLRFTL